METNPPGSQSEEPNTPIQSAIARVSGWRSMTGLTLALGSSLFPLIVLSAFGSNLPDLPTNKRYVSEIELTTQMAKATLGLPSACHTESGGPTSGTNRVVCEHDGSDMHVAARHVDRPEDLPTLARRALRDIAKIAVAEDHPVTTSSSGEQEQARIQHLPETGEPVEVAVLRRNGEAGAYVIEVQGAQPDILGDEPVTDNAQHLADTNQPGDTVLPGHQDPPEDSTEPGNHNHPGGPGTPGPDGKPADPKAVTEYLDDLVNMLATSQAHSTQDQAVAGTPGRTA